MLLPARNYDNRLAMNGVVVFGQQIGESDLDSFKVVLCRICYTSI